MNNIRPLRLKRKMTQVELAAKAGIAQNYLSTLELGNCAPSMATAVKLADALEVSLDCLMGRSTA